MTGRPLRVLFVEDDPDDFLLVGLALEEAGFPVELERVDALEAFREKLLREEWDAVLTDFHLPGFDARAVLALASRLERAPPVLVVSGQVGEEKATELMREGAADLVLKSRLTRLGPALEREVERARWRRDRLEALRLSEQRYRGLVEASAQLVWRTDAAGTAAEPAGWPGGAAGGGWREALHPEDLDRTAAAWAAALAAGSVFEIELRLRVAGGGYRWFVSRGVPIRNPDGTVREWIGTLTDVDDRRRAEERLRESEERFRVMFERAGVGISCLDRAGRFTEMNDSFCQIVGYDRAELLGRSPRDLTHPDDLDDGGAFRRVLTGEMDVCTREKRYLHRSGRTVWVHLIASLIRDEAGLPKSLLTVFEDVTERKEMEDALRVRAEELQRSNRELEQFAYVASHDLQEPLRVVSNYVRLLARSYEHRLDAEGDEMLRFIEGGAKRMQALIQDLLALSRVGTGGRPFSPVELNAVCRQVLDDLRIRIEETGALVDVAPLPRVYADPLQIAQLFQNLIGNALKFRDDRRPCRIGVSARRQGKEWVFSVEDNGIGIPPEFAERIFQVFQRLHTRSEYEGTGIGLSICKKIVERHGGRIWTQASPAGGSIFCFTLPAGHREARPAAEQNFSPAQL